MEKKYILVNDVGTTGTRAVIFDHETNVIAEAYAEIPQVFPKPGWTEQDPVGLFKSCVKVTQRALQEAGLEAGEITAMGHRHPAGEQPALGCQDRGAAL